MKETKEQYIQHEPTITINPNEDNVKDICEILSNTQFPIRDDEYEIYIPRKIKNNPYYCMYITKYFIANVNFDDDLSCYDEYEIQSGPPSELMKELNYTLQQVRLKRAERGNLQDVEISQNNKEKLNMSGKLAKDVNIPDAFEDLQVVSDDVQVVSKFLPDNFQDDVPLKFKCMCII